MFIVNPFSQRKLTRLGFNVVLMVMLLALRILGSAMLTEPAITNVEEVSRLMHLSTS